MNAPDTKIFSVAVENRKPPEVAAGPGQPLKVLDVDTDFSGRFAVVSTPGEKQTLDESSVMQTNPAKKSSKGKKRNKNNALNMKEAESRKTTPPKRTESTEDIEAEVPPARERAFKSKEESSLEEPCMVAMTNAPNVKVVEEDTKSDDFKEILNRKVDSDQEEDDIFRIREESSSPVQEMSSETSVDISKDAAARQPNVSSNWVNDLLKSDKPEAILRSIEKSEELWEDNERSGGFKTSSIFSKVDAHQESSEDDFDFRPSFNMKGKKKNSSDNQQGGSDFEASKDRLKYDLDPHMVEKDGWSIDGSDFGSQLDDFLDPLRGGDQGKIFGDSNSGNDKATELLPTQQQEEKTALEDVFKFDSELSNHDENLLNLIAMDDHNNKAISLEDLNDALEEGEDGSGEENNGLRSRSLTSSLNVESRRISNLSSLSRSSGGMSTSMGSTSESSVGNSPNPKKNNQKKRKKKKK